MDVIEVELFCRRLCAVEVVKAVSVVVFFSSFIQLSRGVGNVRDCVQDAGAVWNQFWKGCISDDDRTLLVPVSLLSELLFAGRIIGLT